MPDIAKISFARCIQSKTKKDIPLLAAKFIY